MKWNWITIKNYNGRLFSMKKTLKQINSFIIVLVIALSISATAFAADVESVRPSVAYATPWKKISKTVTDSEKNR